jgi:3-oxoadipate CoA-transferase alpha subunit
VIDKRRKSALDALQTLRDGQSIMVGGFGSSGLPTELLNAVIEHGARNLTIISNNAGYDNEGVAVLIAAGRVRKLVCSYPLTQGATAFRQAWAQNTIELELLTQGTLVERIRCAGAGLGGVLNPVTVGTALAHNQPVIRLNSKDYVVEEPLRADFALIRAHRADRLGNLVYRLGGRNFNPVMATAASTVIAQADHMAEPGELDPETIATPGIFVHHVITPQQVCSQ